ncbi:MAG: ATP-binding protein [Candidatus Micrarchaeia archaeon]
MENEPLGIVVGEAQPHKFTFLAKRGVRVGEYVTVEASEGRILGLVEASTVRSSLLNTADNYYTALEGKNVASKNVRDKGYIALVRTMGLLEDLKKGVINIPSLAPEPGSEVMEASYYDLREVFCKEEIQWAKIGVLLRDSKIPVSINIDKLASRHLAILATTGGGKSNLLALLAKKISEVNGTMIIFDYHGEYSGLNILNVTHSPARINPKLMDSDKLADLLEVRESASVQRTILSKTLKENVVNAEDFWNTVLQNLEQLRNDTKDKQEARAAARLQEIIEMALRRMKPILDPDMGDPLDQIKPYHVNILDMSEFTERQADVVVSFYLDRVLEDRKRAKRLKTSNEGKSEVKPRFMEPVVCAIEEAHVFIPNDIETETKYIASKIAREGRKFGVALIIVSQRPSRVDQDVLSQMGSFAIMRIIQPRDQAYISEVCETISEELVKYLPSLNVGETILLGQWVSLPSLAKIYKVEEKVMGADISAVNEWKARAELSKIAYEDTSELIREAD